MPVNRQRVNNKAGNGPWKQHLAAGAAAMAANGRNGEGIPSSLDRQQQGGGLSDEMHAHATALTEIIERKTPSDLEAYLEKVFAEAFAAAERAEAEAVAVTSTSASDAPQKGSGGGRSKKSKAGESVVVPPAEAVARRAVEAIANVRCTHQNTPLHLVCGALRRSRDNSDDDGDDDDDDECAKDGNSEDAKGSGEAPSSDAAAVCDRVRSDDDGGRRDGDTSDAYKFASILLRYGAAQSLSLYNDDHESPLHLACDTKAGDWRLMELLLLLVPPTFTTHGDDESPLLPLVCRDSLGDGSVAPPTHYVNTHINPNATDARGSTPLNLAVGSTEVTLKTLQVLVDGSAAGDPHCHQRGEDYNHRKSPAASGSAPIVGVEKGVDGSVGSAACDAAEQTLVNNNNTTASDNTANTTRLPLHFTPADVNAEGQFGLTVLHHLVMANSRHADLYEMVSYLISKGAYVHARDDRGRGMTVLQRLKKQKRMNAEEQRVAKLLIGLGCS